MREVRQVEAGEAMIQPSDMAAESVRYERAMTRVLTTTSPTDHEIKAMQVPAWIAKLPTGRFVSVALGVIVLPVGHRRAPHWWIRMRALEEDKPEPLEPEEAAVLVQAIARNENAAVAILEGDLSPKVLGYSEITLLEATPMDRGQMHRMAQSVLAVVGEEPAVLDTASGETLSMIVRKPLSMAERDHVLRIGA